MPEIYLCEIARANVRQLDGHRSLSMEIPEKPNIHLKPDIRQSEEYARAALEELKSTGYAKIADENNPIRPPSAGCLDLLTDSAGNINYVVMFQKDLLSPRNPGGHVIFNGFPSSFDDWVNFGHMEREPAEEVAYVDRKDNALLLPADAEASIEAARSLEEKAKSAGLDTGFAKRLSNLPYEMREGRDEIVVSHRGKDFKIRAALSWYPEVDIAVYRFLRLSPEDVWVHDLEGFWRDCVIAKPEDLKGKKTGDEFQAIIMRYPKDENGRPLSCKREVANGTVKFKPAAILRQALFGIGIYPNDWTEDFPTD